MKTIRKHIIRGTALSIFISILFFPYAINASPISIGPFVGNSWELGNSWSSPLPFVVSAIEIFILNEDPLGDPIDFEMASDVGTYNAGGSPWISDFGWTSSLINPDYVYASGPVIANPNTLGFWNYFTGDYNKQGFLLHFLLYDENNILKHIQPMKGNYAFPTFLASISNGDPNDPMYDRTPSAVPEPSTLLLLGVGLVGLAGFRRKFRG